MWRTRVLLLCSRRNLMKDLNLRGKLKTNQAWKPTCSLVPVPTALCSSLEDRRISSLSPKPSTVATLPEKCVAAAPSWLQPHLKLLRLHRPAGTWLLYIPCAWSIAFAADPGCLPSLYYLTLFGVGAIVMRGAGCIINDMWDRDFDRKVDRTKLRPLADGTLSMREAFTNLFVQLSVGLIVLLQLNLYSVGMGFGSMVLVITYPLFKRITYWPQVVLGLAFNWGALMGWAAVKGACDWTVCLPLYFAGILWTLYYDTVYAHQDKTDDILVGVKSLALKLGNGSKMWFYGFTGAMTVSFVVAGIAAEQTLPYFASLGAASIYLVHQIRTLDLDDTKACWDAFCSQRLLGLWILGGIIFGTLAKKNSKIIDSDLLNSSSPPIGDREVT